mmetsp:Transcript_32112/g.68363  ORF Transcript_32112/g.68363 Transcript_32112/m.68363 type:complete len:713 (-) Transcript_32112:7-2145(-)
MGRHVHQPLSPRGSHGPNVIFAGQCKFFKQYPLRFIINGRAGMNVDDLIVLHSEVIPLPLKVGHLHVHCICQRHSNGIRVVAPVASLARDQRNVQPGHDPRQLLLHARRAGYGPIVDEIVPAPLLPLVAGDVLVGREGVQQRDVVARRVDELRLRLVGCLGALPRPQEDLGHAHCRHDVHYLLGAAVVGTADQHLRQLGIQGQLGHLPSQVCHVALVVKRAEVVEHLQRAHQRLRRGRIHEVEVHEVVDPELFQSQHHVGHFAPQDFRICCLLQIVVEGLFGVQAEALPRAGTSRSACPLSRRGAGDGAHQQRLDAYAWVVHLLLAEPRVDDVHYSIDGQRRLCDVGRDDDLSPRRPPHRPRPGRGREYLPLLRRRERRVQRVDHQLRRVLPHILRPQPYLLAGLLDLLLSRQEHKHIARTLALVYLYRRPNRRLDVVPFRLGRVEYFHGECAARHLEERGAVEVGLKLLRVERGGHDDNLELAVLAPLLPLGEDLHQQPHQHVSRQSPLVRLVQNDHGVPAQQRIVHRLPQKHPVRQELEHRLVRVAHVLEPNRVPHRPPQRHVHLLRDAGGNARRRHPPRLGAPHARSSRAGVPNLDQELRDLRRLSASRLSLHDDRLAPRHSLQQLGLKLVDGELEPGLEDGAVAGRVGPAGPGVDLRGLAGVEGGLVLLREAINGRVEVYLSLAIGGASHRGDKRICLFRSLLAAQWC